MAIELTVAELEARLGEEVASSPWLVVDQPLIDGFARVTGDDQWIHVDVARAAASPFGTTIAHGFLTLALMTDFMRQAISIQAGTILNYGLDRVRFVTPVPAGGRIRGRFVPSAVSIVGDEAAQVAWTVTVDLEGSRKPAAVAEWILRYGDIVRPPARTT